MTLAHLYIKPWKLHFSGNNLFSLFYCESGLTPQTEPCQKAEVFGGSFRNRKKEGPEKKERRPQVSPCGGSQSLHGQPYPAAPHEPFHMQQVDGQAILQLLTHPLWAPPVCAVHGHTQEWHQQEEAGEQGEVWARRCRLIGYKRNSKNTFFFFHNFDL